MSVGAREPARAPSIWSRPVAPEPDILTEIAERLTAYRYQRWTAASTERLSLGFCAPTTAQTALLRRFARRAWLFDSAMDERLTKLAVDEDYQMALIRCPDCEKMISDSAMSCPNCGRPASAQSSSTGIRIESRPAAKKKGYAPFIIVGLVLVVVVTLVQSQGEIPVQSRPPGTGRSIADSVYLAVMPKPGESPYPDDPDIPHNFLMDRLNDAAESHPSWKFSQPDFTFRSDGSESSLRLRFSDGSSLVLFDSKNQGEGTGLRYDSARVE